MSAPFGRRRLAVTERCEYGAYVVLHLADPDGPAPRPGQFYMLTAVEGWGGGEGERPFLPRAFSVLRALRTEMAAASGGLALHFLFEDVGPGTHRLCALGDGEELWVAGPFGNGFVAPRAGRRPVLCGGGVGIAPLAIWQDELGLDARVLLGFRGARQAEGAAVLGEAELATDDGSTGHAGLVTDLLGAVLADGTHAEVYACGPPSMLEAVRGLCTAAGVPAQLALESGMACGFGACFGCVVPTRNGYLRLCVDGPVVEAARLEVVR